MGGNYSYEEAVRVLKRDTRHFAKRQLTWFRRQIDGLWIDLSLTDKETALVDMLDYVKQCGISLPEESGEA